MNAFSNTHADEVVALGWTLLHFCWQSTLISIVYALLDRCAVRATTSVRYGIAVIALAAMPIVFVATLLQQDRLVSHSLGEPQHLPVSQLGTTQAALIERVPLAAPAVSNSELWVAGHASLLLPCLDILWLAGVLFLTARAFGQWWELRLLRRRAQAAVPQALLASFERLARRFQLSHRVILLLSSEVISPMVFGVWRTIVVMPLSAALALEPEQLEAVLAHELAHIRRWDYLCNLLQTTVECFFFFQPAVWWVGRRAREFREICCDEIAANACADPVVYAEALLQLEEQRARHLQLAMGLQGNGGTLLDRVRRVMGETAMDQRKMSGVRIAAVAMALVGLYVAPHMAHGIKFVSTPEDPSTESGIEKRSVVAAPSRAAHPQLAEAVTVSSVAPVARPAVAAGKALSPSLAPSPEIDIESTASLAPEPSEGQQSGGMEYLQKMRDAGYPLDLDKDLDQIVALRSVGVTPEYAKSMAQVGLGTPSSRELLALKSQGVTPEYISSLKGTILAPASFHDVVTVKALGITAQYAKSLEMLGLGTPTERDVVRMKALGVTAEYVASLKASGIAPTDLQEAASMKALGVTSEYASSMAAAGFTGLSPHELISMRAQGLTPEYAKWLKATFPDADSHTMRQAIVFHVDAAFVAKAKANGFNSASLDKLNKLKMSGLLN